MGKKYRRMKKTLALTLALVMVLGILPLGPVASAVETVSTVTVTGAPTTITYGDVPFQISFTVNNPEPITFSVADATVAEVYNVSRTSATDGTAMVRILKAGNIAIHAEQAKSGEPEEGFSIFTGLVTAGGEHTVLQKRLTWNNNGVVASRQFNGHVSILADITTRPTLGGIVGNDDVSINWENAAASTSITLADANAGRNSSFTVAGYEDLSTHLTGTHATNYLAPNGQPRFNGNNTVTIDPAIITITPAARDKFFGAPDSTTQTLTEHYTTAPDPVPAIGAAPTFEGVFEREAGENRGSYLFTGLGSFKIAEGFTEARTNYDLRFANPDFRRLYIRQATASDIDNIKSGLDPSTPIDKFNAFDVRNAGSVQAVIDFLIAAGELPTKVQAIVPGMSNTYEMGITWAPKSSSQAYNAKGGITYIAEGTLVGDNNVAAGAVTREISITIGTVTLPRPAWLNVPGQILRNPNGGKINAGSQELSGVLRANGVQTHPAAPNVSISYNIVWNNQSPVINTSILGEDRTFAGVLSYPNAAAYPWLTIDPGAVTRRVTVENSFKLDFDIDPSLGALDAAYTGAPYQLKGNPIPRVNAVELPVADRPNLKFQYTGTGDYDSAVPPTNVGSYTLTITIDPPDERYRNATPNVFNFEIVKRELVLVADDIRIFVGDPRPTLTYHIEDDSTKPDEGLAPGQTLTDAIVVEPTLRLNGTFNSSTTGDIEIVIAHARSSANYNINISSGYKNGELTIVTAYNITVTDGTAKESNGAVTTRFGEDEEVTLTADADDVGRFFARWEIFPNDSYLSGVNLTAREVKFDMPAHNVTARAIFTDAPVDNTLPITVIGGTSSVARALPGATVTITARVPAGREFVNWTASSGVVLANATSRTTSFTMPQSGVTITANFRSITGPSIPTEPLFKDVTSGPAFRAVQWAATMRYIQGHDGNFMPKVQMSRAQFAVILHRYAGEPRVTATNNFADVTEGTTIGRAVAWAHNTGIVTGRSSTVFGTNDSITRESMVLMLYRYHTRVNGGSNWSGSSVINSFADRGSVTSAAVTAMNWAVENGLITGNNNNLVPKGNITRDQVVTILYRYDRVFN
ncbi:MAG: S-layer homology domain-containing protein [Oscillospiraceae bacterium]|jgi:hypothetical protein|nr:S-layer homology domain-containing protein [Oscillospiraceae bacterium]